MQLVSRSCNQIRFWIWSAATRRRFRIFGKRAPSKIPKAATSRRTPYPKFAAPHDLTNRFFIQCLSVGPRHSFTSRRRPLVTSRLISVRVMNQPSAELLERLRTAAELRAAGMGWDVVAARVGAKAGTCSRWPSRHRDLWRALMREALRLTAQDSAIEAR